MIIDEAHRSVYQKYGAIFEYFDFAKNHEHAALIAERFNQNHPHYKGKFARVIDNYERFAEDLIEKFSMAQEQPVIAVSVDMLDIGIDVPRYPPLPRSLWSRSRQAGLSGP